MLRPGFDVEFHMRRIKYFLSRFELKTTAFYLDVASNMRRIEFVSAGNTAMDIIKLTFSSDG